MKGCIPAVTKVIIAFVCFINFSLLLFDLGQLPRPQFWIAFLPYFIMLIINTFLMVRIFLQNQLCMLVWLLSYTFLLTLGSILLLQQKFPFYLPIASRVFDDAITIFFSLQRSTMPVYGMTLSLVAYLIVMAGLIVVLNYISLSEQEILPMRHLHQGCSPFMSRRNTSAGPEIESTGPACPPIYLSARGKPPTYSEVLRQSLIAGDCSTNNSPHRDAQHHIPAA